MGEQVSEFAGQDGELALAVTTRQLLVNPEDQYQLTKIHLIAIFALSGKGFSVVSLRDLCGRRHVTERS